MNVLVSAYLDHNVGDDLFVEILAKRYPQVEFWLWTDPAEKLNPALEELPNLKRVRIRHILLNVFRISAWVIIGGSIFQEAPGLMKYHLARLRWQLLFRAFGVKTFFLGANIGPVVTGFGRAVFKACIALSGGIVVRDRYSYDLLAEWGLSKKSGYGADIVLSYPMAAEPAIIADGGGRKTEILGISIMNYMSGRLQADYIEKMAKIANEYLHASPDGRVLLFGFDGGRENDGVCIKKVLGFIEEPFEGRVEVVQYGNHIPMAEFLKRFSMCSSIIGCRFHSIVLSILFKIPCIPVRYSKKTDNLLSDIGYQGVSYEYQHMREANASEVVSIILERKAACIDAAEYAKSANNHFKYLDTLLAP